MSEIDAIPEDILATAKATHLEARRLDITFEEALARALLAERNAQREQCAKIAVGFRNRGGTSESLTALIAAAIRKQQEPT